MDVVPEEDIAGDVDQSFSVSQPPQKSQTASEYAKHHQLSREHY